MTTLDQTFVALADPTRRSVLKMLANKGPVSISALYQVNKKISRQAFEKHINVLSKANLVSKSKQGRKAIMTLEASRLKDVLLWVEQCEKLWDQKLKDLGDYLDKKK